MVEQGLSGVPGSSIKSIKRLFSNDELAAMRIIYPGMPERQILNAYRDIRTRLMQRASGGNFIVLVSSLSDVDGSRNTVAMNIAASIALDEQSTALYVDCNLEDPRGEMLLMQKPRYGLNDYLVDGGFTPEDIIYFSGIPRLSVLPVGKLRSTAVEHLASPRMGELLAELKTQAPRTIIIDVPPIEHSVVARILAPHCDQAVLAVPFGEVSRGQILSGVDAVGANRVAGLVFAY